MPPERDATSLSLSPRCCGPAVMGGWGWGGWPRSGSVHPSLFPQDEAEPPFRGRKGHLPLEAMPAKSRATSNPQDHRHHFPGDPQRVFSRAEPRSPSTDLGTDSWLCFSATETGLGVHGHS